MRFKTWKTWTTKELERLEALRMDGLSAQRIADQLGRTLASVKCRLAGEGIERPRSLKWLYVLVKPHGIAELAARMGVTKWAVKQQKRKLRRAGFDIPAAERPSRPCRALSRVEALLQ